MNAKQLEIRKLTLRREPCYGTCPVYEVTLLADGTVTWVGEIFIDSVGPASWTIPIDRVLQIQEALRRAGFRSLADSYTGYDMTDAPSCNIMVEFADGTSKAVAHYHGDFSPERGGEELTGDRSAFDVVIKYKDKQTWPGFIDCRGYSEPNKSPDTPTPLFAFRPNLCPLCLGMSVRIPSESLCALPRNVHSNLSF